MPRATPYTKKTQALRKKASELAILCGVQVALVCAPAAGAGAEARLVWESDEGVIDRYRGAAVKPDARARHTHRSYLEAELGKERAKLARARPGALADWDPALNDMTPDEAREVLETIDAALRAAGDRMVALGLTTEGEHVDSEQTVPQQMGLDGMEDARFQMQMVHCQGGNNDGGLLEQFPWEGRFPMQPGYGIEPCVGSNYDVGAVGETRAPASYGHNADCGWPDLTMWYANDESCLPAGYYDPKLVDGALAPEHYSAQVVTGGSYIDMPRHQYPMGMDENFTNLDNSYTAQWPAQEYLRSGTNSSMEENYSCDDESCLPAGYYDPKFVDDTRAPEHYSAQVVTGRGYIDTLPHQYPMGMDENFSYVDKAQWQAEEFQLSDTNSSKDEKCTYLDNNYAAHWQTENFQRSHNGTGQYQYQFSDPGTSSSSQVSHHRY